MRQRKGARKQTKVPAAKVQATKAAPKPAKAAAVPAGTRTKSKDECPSNTFQFTRRVFLHLLGLIYFTAFLVAWHQNDGLIGEAGLTPAKPFMQKLLQRFAGNNASMTELFQGFVQRPTLLWFVEIDNFYSALNVITITGLALSAFLLVLGRANSVLLFLLWILYFSIDTVGQRWYSFGWESQLLETGFLAIFSVPLLSLSSLAGSPPRAVVVWGYRWLMFRLMIGAGLIKLRGDQCWLDLTFVGLDLCNVESEMTLRTAIISDALCVPCRCMHYHYETQPVPSQLSWFLHFNFPEFHKFETLVRG